MPQMAPLMWTFLFFLFLIIFMLMILINYFIKFFHQKKKSKKIPSFSYFWKW